MIVNRRKFLKVSLSGAAITALSGTSFAACAPAAASKANEAVLKLSFQENTPPGKSLNEKLDYMEQLGIVGFEPGGGGLANRVDEIQKALSNRNIKVSAICAGFKGF
ncbi:hypothetical protein EZS27_038710, partial [termite gut metagenome]